MANHVLTTLVDPWPGLAEPMRSPAPKAALPTLSDAHNLRCCCATKITGLIAIMLTSGYAQSNVARSPSNQNGQRTPIIATNDNAAVESRVRQADLIIAARIARSVGGSSSRTYWFKDETVLFGAVTEGRTLIASGRPTLFSLAAKPDTKWIIFLAKPTDSADKDYDDRFFIGDLSDTNAMLIATGENMALVKSLISKKANQRK